MSLFRAWAALYLLYLLLPPGVAAVRAAADAVGKILGDKSYAIVRGAACALLGSSRTTTNVDIVVLRGHNLETRKLLRDQEGLAVEKGTLYTYFIGSLMLRFLRHRCYSKKHSVTLHLVRNLVFRRC